MRPKAQDSLTQALSNGVTVKGCYKHSLNGTHFDLYVLSPLNEILATHHIGVSGHAPNPGEILQNEVGRIAAALKLYRFDQLKEVPIQIAAAEYVLRVLYPKSKERKAAA